MPVKIKYNLNFTHKPADTSKLQKGPNLICQMKEAVDEKSVSSVDGQTPLF